MVRDVQNASTTTPEMSKRVLLAGGIGVGKTTQFRTLKGKKFMYVFDSTALPSLEGADIDYVTFIPDISDLEIAVKTLKKDVGDKNIRNERLEPKTYREWEDDYQSRGADGFFEKYDWVGFDSLTTFSDIVMDRVQYLNGRLGKQPEQADWTAQMNTIRNVFRVATNLGTNIFATAHVEIQKDETLGKTYGQIILTGKLRIRLPLLFSDIFACHCEEVEGKARFLLQTIPDRMNPVIRTTLRDLKMFENITIDWKKPVEGQGIGRWF